jgi:DNA-directed RNA polymerase specialized sigma24 family protein
VSGDAVERVRERVDAVYRAESRRVFATLIRLLGDFDLAEEALHDAFRAALEQWPRDGVPANPRAWLVSTGRFKAIDGIRRRARFDTLDDDAEPVDPATEDAAAWDDGGWAERPKPESPTNAPSASRSRNRSNGFSNAACASCRNEARRILASWSCISYRCR